MKKKKHIDDQDKENLQLIKNTVPINNTSSKEYIQTQIDSQIENAPTYYVLTKINTHRLMKSQTKWK